MAKRFELMTRDGRAIRLVPEQKDLKWRTKKHQRLKKRSNEDLIATRRYLWSNFNANVWTRMTPRLFHSKTLSLRQHSFSFSFSWMKEWMNESFFFFGPLRLSISRFSDSSEPEPKRSSMTNLLHTHAPSFLVIGAPLRRGTETERIRRRETNRMWSGIESGWKEKMDFELETIGGQWLWFSW